jgi:hypothetical protein
VYGEWGGKRGVMGEGWGGQAGGGGRTIVPIAIPGVATILAAS